MRPHRAFLAAAVLVGLGAVGPAAHAQARRAAALPPRLSPDDVPALRERFLEAVRRGIEGAGFAAQAARGQPPCGDAVCATRAAELLGVDAAAAMELEVVGRRYTGAIRVAGSAGEGAEEPLSCPICTLSEADEAIVAAARRAGERLATRLASRSAPPAPGPRPPAAVPPPSPTADAPPPRLAPPGPVATATGASPAAGSAPIPLVAVGAPADDPAHARKLRRLRLGALLTAGVAVVGVGLGVTLLSLDGDPTCSAPDPEVSCPEVYSTGAAGGVLLGLGLTSLVASGTLFTFDYLERRPPAVTVALAPVAGGGLLSAGIALP